MSSASSPNFGSGSISADAKPATRPSTAATTVLVVFGAAVSTRSHSAWLSSTRIAAR